MSGNEFLADTNSLIYILEGKSFMLPFLMNMKSLSIISEIELRGYYQLSEEEDKIIKSLLNDLNIISVSFQIKELAIKLKRKYKLKTLDSIIAATAIQQKLTLLTADKHFNKIDELDLILIEL
jgi:predicted nucleic acid-binding protein